MAKINIFSRPILIDYLDNENLNKEIKQVLKEEEQKKYINKKSNIGGFQTLPVNNKNICETILIKTIQMFEENFNFKQKTNFTLLNLWINKNQKNNYNMPHTHPHSNFSGVYYCEVSKEGSLIFLQDDPSALAGNETFFYDQEFSNTYNCVPEKNKIIIFPSGILHMVQPHNEEKDRISVSFNIGLEHLNGI